MELSIERIEILLLVSAVVAMLVRRLRVPYSVGLVIAGIGLALLPITADFKLTKELIFTAFLPPLVFEAALYIRWRELKRDLIVILTLATVGVLLSAGFTALGMHYLARWDWSSAALFGILIAATDPVSVIAAFKEAGVRGRLKLLVEAESLLNDGTAAVAFGVALTLATGGNVTFLDITKTLLATVFGGVLCGAAVAGGILLLAGQTEDHLVEITFTTVAAYGSFFLAEHLRVSGVLASLTAGLMVGNLGFLGSISKKGRESVEAFWEYVAFVVNSLIFILIGIHEAHQSFAKIIIVAGAAVVLVTIGRAVAIYSCCALFWKSSLQVEQKHQHILFWGGLRGALALALALGLPPSVAYRDEIVTVSLVLVAFSVIVQGLTITPFIRKIGELPPP
jgi:monovalent cation:H+ antiporter, CPA1 family